MKRLYFIQNYTKLYKIIQNYTKLDYIIQIILFYIIYICSSNMGQSEAKSKTDVINLNEFDIDQSTRNKIQSDCYSNTFQKNLVQIVGSKVSDLTTDQVNEVKNLCVLQTMIENTKDAKISNDIMTKISEQLEAKGGLPGTGGKSESVSKVYNRMKMDIDQSVVNEISKNCIMNQKQENIIQIFGSNVKGSKMGQTNKNFVDCLQTYGEVTGITSDAANTAKAEFDKSVKATAMDPTQSLASLGQMFMVYVGAVALVFLGSSAISAMSLGGGGGGGGGAGTAAASSAGGSDVGGDMGGDMGDIGAMMGSLGKGGKMGKVSGMLSKLKSFKK
jgi:hypothetical protein